MTPNVKRNALRFLIGPAVIVAIFFFDQSREFVEVWKPLALFYALAIPGFLLVDRLRAKHPGNQGASS